jgi:hypothetical protein
MTRLPGRGRGVALEAHRGGGGWGVEYWDGGWAAVPGVWPPVRAVDEQRAPTGRTISTLLFGVSCAESGLLPCRRQTQVPGYRMMTR